jgi:hypothetical protein
VEVGDCWDDELGAEGGEWVLFILGFGVGLAEEVYCFPIGLIRHGWISGLRVLRVCRRIERSRELSKAVDSGSRRRSEVGEMMACRQNIRA